MASCSSTDQHRMMAVKIWVDKQGRVLANINEHLVNGRTDKSRLITARIWLKKIARDFAGMKEIRRGLGRRLTRLSCAPQLNLSWLRRLWWLRFDRTG
jgi:hypothetical protein